MAAGYLVEVMIRVSRRPRPVDAILEAGKIEHLAIPVITGIMMDRVSRGDIVVGRIGTAARVPRWGLAQAGYCAVSSLGIGSTVIRRPTAFMTLTMVANSGCPSELSAR